jgi:hypothetical protein
VSLLSVLSLLLGPGLVVVALVLRLRLSKLVVVLTL